MTEAVREAEGSVFENSYAEGYPHADRQAQTEAEILDYERQLPFFRRNADRRYYKGVEYCNIVEALAQTGGIAVGSMEEYKGRIAFFAGIDNVRFKRQVKPGDTLRLEVELTQLRRSIGMASALATVEGEVACKGDIMFALGPPMSELS